MNGLSWARCLNLSAFIPGTQCGKYPPYVKFILRYLSAEIKEQRHYACSTRIITAGCSPRLDAQASSNRTGTGGCFPVADQEGKLSPWLSGWFSLEIHKDDFPWVFERGDRPSLVTSILETLAILVALKLRFGDAPDADEQTGPCSSFSHR